MSEKKGVLAAPTVEEVVTTENFNGVIYGRRKTGLPYGSVSL